MSDCVSGQEKSSLTAGATGIRQGVLREKGKGSSKSFVYRGSAEEKETIKSSRESSVYKGSEEYFEYACDPCTAEGEHVEAQGFCTNCKEYLCSTCFKGHSRSKTSRHHTLLDKNKMPRNAVPLCDPCEISGDEEEAAGYCEDCDEYLCSDCFKSHTRSKTSKQHVLFDKNNMPGRMHDAISSAVAKMNISKRDADLQTYTEEYTYIRDINVKTDEDEKDCFITDMTLVTSTQLILADQDNKSLKLVDLENNVIKGNLRLQEIPGGLTTISQNQIAVILFVKCKIQIISISEELSVIRTLNTIGTCVYMMFINGKLYASFWNPVKFQILQLTGAVSKTIRPDSEVLKHCTFPGYIAVSPDESTIYISDWKNNTVMCIDMNGSMISMFQSELDKPTGITISPFGSVYLCNRRQHVVYKMTSDLSEATVILGDGLEFPEAMCFNDDKQHLYISSGSSEAKHNNFVKVYKWK